MTRKQALSEAIQLIEKARVGKKHKEETVSALQLCIAELPFSRWSKEAIFDACDQFIIDNGRNIHVNDFVRRELPSHPTIKNRFGMTACEFRNLYYPIKSSVSTRSPYCEKTADEWKQLFKQEYIRLKPTSGNDFNTRREKSLPTWITIARMLRLKRWNDLLYECGLAKNRRGSFEFKVESTSHLEREYHRLFGNDEPF